MRRRKLYAMGASVALALLAGWGVGSVHGDCEHSCPASGPCPTPAECLRHPFNWTAALVAGAAVLAITVMIGLAVLRGRTGD